jgi:bis(5'-nucleosyl)-tetraphosphatase (symmetrical)
MLHAGLPPQWDLQQSQECAAEAEAALRGPNYRSFLAWMFGSEPRRWHPDLQGVDRFRFTVNCLTRMRFCQSDGALNFSEKGPPGSQPPNLLPWFDLPGRRSADMNIIFGHWASLGHYRAPGIWALDSGCAWGGCLTALRLDGPAAIEQIDCSELRRG